VHAVSLDTCTLNLPQIHCFLIHLEYLSDPLGYTLYLVSTEMTYSEDPGPPSERYYQYVLLGLIHGSEGSKWVILGMEELVELE